MSHNARIREGFKKMEEKKTTIYFAHSAKSWKSKREQRIIEILESRGFEVINPFDYEEAINKKYGVNSYTDNPTEPHANDIVEKDYELVKNCDELFAWFTRDTSMTGTPLEVCWAKNMGKKVTVLYYRKHPFMLSKRIGVYKLYISYQDFKNDKPLFVRE